MNDPLAPTPAERHRQAFVVDAHFDLPFDILNRRERGESSVYKTRHHQRLVDGGIDLAVAAVFVEDFFLPEMGLRRALDEIVGLLEDLEAAPGLATVCRSMAAVRSARASGQIALLLSLEGADPIGGDLGLLRAFYELGVRGLGLTWSRRNHAADGCSFQEIRRGASGGLTAFGTALVEKAQSLGMVIDVSHINDEGFWDVMTAAAGPVIASHSNCRALTDIPRNISDRQIEALAKKGGVMGINAINKFLHDDPAKATLEHLLDHVDHAVAVAGIDHVGIGLDLCDGFENWHRLPLGPQSRDVIDGHGRFPDITAGLLRRGYSGEAVAKILGENFERVFCRIL
ncbi:MAG: dipeptidase [Desulfobacterales bacterium]|jgi:membrane dipeptidase